MWHYRGGDPRQTLLQLRDLSWPDVKNNVLGLFCPPSLRWQNTKAIGRGTNTFLKLIPTGNEGQYAIDALLLVYQGAGFWFCLGTWKGINKLSAFPFGSLRASPLVGLVICSQTLQWTGTWWLGIPRNFWHNVFQQSQTTWPQSWGSMSSCWAFWEFVLFNLVTLQNLKGKCWPIKELCFTLLLLDPRKHCSMHICNLGLYHVRNAEALTILAEHRASKWGCTYQEALEHLYHDFRKFCLMNKITCSQRRFKIHTVSAKGIPEYIIMITKAFNARVILAYVADTLLLNDLCFKKVLSC